MSSDKGDPGSITRPSDDDTIAVGRAEGADDTVDLGTRLVRGAQPAAEGLEFHAPIAPAPGHSLWQHERTGERGVSQGLPVSYGARVHGAVAPRSGPDEVLRVVGAPPADSRVELRLGREALPSLERRERRSRAVTLVLYGIVSIACLGALLGVASLVFR